MYVFYRSRNNAKDPNGQFCYKFLRLYKMICWIRHIFSFRIHDSLLMLWESLIHDFLPSIGFLCGERRSSIQTDLVIRFHAAAQRKIISNPLHLRVAFLFLTATLHSKLEILTTWESQKVKLGQINYCRMNGINIFIENSDTFRNWDVFFIILIFLIALWRTHTPSKTELSNFQNQPCDIPSS